MPHQSRDVFGALAQGRDFNGEHTEAVVEIPAELPAFHHLHQTSVGRRHEPKVHLDRLRTPQPLEFALLQDAQEFRLQFQRNIPHFVEKQGSLVGQLDAPNRTPYSAGECSSLVAKQFALEQPRRN